MDTFQAALDAYLASHEGGESAFAAAIGTTQASVNRYRNSKRFPDAETARRIDKVTRGKVPFSTWQADFLARSGIAA